MAEISKITLPNGDEYDLKDNNAIPSSEKAVAGGVATLDENGLVPQSQMPGMVILSYGNNTWDDFLEAYQKNNIIYCRASSNSNPASGSQTRLAFMAYVNNATSPTEVEFQYYRSVSSHNATQQGDQVYVYKLTNKGVWTVTVREAYTRVTTNNGLTSTWSGGVLTASADIVSTTKLNSAATAATETAGMVYPVALDANGKLAVHVDDKSVRISQAEYDALTETEKNSDTVYYIYDAPYDMPDVVTLSLAEYNALSEEEKNNGLFYYVYDDTTTASTLVVQTNQDNANTVPSSKVLYDAYQDFLNYKDVISFDITLESSVVASCTYAKCVIKSGWAFISINNFVFKAAGNAQIIARGLPHAIYQAGATPSGTNASLTKTVVGDVAYLFPSNEILRAHANTDSYNQAHWYYFSYPIDPSWTMPS